ncbi:MAG: cell division transport system permease protein [Clostridiales bacterium]|jgi:cell division transport system permease protein|nr:cell division transport system permease protein [Clostridiales bacterium]
MKASTLGYSLKQGTKNIWKNRLFSIASISTMAACLFIFSIFFIVMINFQSSIDKMQTALGVTTLFEEDMKEEDILKLKNEIEKRAEVESVIYVTAAQAWENYKAGYSEEGRELLEMFGDDNPLANSASFEIHLKDVAMQDAFVEYLESVQGTRNVRASAAAANMIMNTGLLISYISLGVTIVLLCVAIFLIGNTVTVGITVRKDEIKIMKLIGATDFFVKAPFIFEGILLGVIGAIIPLTLTFYAYKEVVTYLSKSFDDLNKVLAFVPPITVLKSLIPVSLILGIGIGFIGSYLTVRKHIRD